MADPQFDQALAQANALLTQGKWDEALGILIRLHQSAPDRADLYQLITQIGDKKGDIALSVEYYLKWAQLCQARGEFDDALKLYQHVLSLEGGSEKKSAFKAAGNDKIKEYIARYRPEISLQMGSIFLQKNLADEAIKYLKGALDSPQGAQDSRVHTLLGIAYMQKNMDKEAIGEFQEVVRLDPNGAAFAYEKLGEIFIRGGKPPQSTIVWFRNAGDLYLRNEQFRDATRSYEMILSFEPRNKDVMNRLADIYTQQGMRDKALDTYRQLAVIFTEEGLLDKVIILYEKLTDINPEDEESWAKLVDIYRGILQRDPSNLSVRLKLIKYLVVKNDLDSAIPEYLALAGSYMEKGIHDEAHQVIMKLLEVDPQNVRAREMLGDIFMKRGEQDLALSEYLMVVSLYRDSGEEGKSQQFAQKLMTIFPQAGELHYQLSRGLRDQGSYGEALKELQEVLDANPDHVPALVDAAEMLAAMQRHEEARAMYHRILEIEPERTDVRMSLLGYHLQAGELDAAREQVDRLSATLQETGLHREAETLYRRLQAYYPENPEIRERICELRIAQGDGERALHEYLLLANMFVKQKLLERAATMYARIVEFRPDNLNAHYRLAKTMAQQGLKPQALAHFANLAAAYTQRNLNAQALNVLTESVDIDPENVELRERLVDLLVGQLRIEDATGHFKQLVRTQLAAGQLDEATRRVQEVISLKPMDLDLRLELASMYLEFNHLQEGQALLEELVNAYLQKKQIPRVIDIYAKMAQIFRLQDRWDLYWSIRERGAELYRQEGQEAQALAEYQEILEGALRAGHVDRAHALFPTLSDLYFQTDRAMDGVRAFERVVENFSRDGNAREAAIAQDFLIKLLERRGDRTQALELLWQIAERGLETGERELALSTYGRIALLLVESGDLERAVATQFIRVGILLRDKDLTAARQIYEDIRTHRPDSIEDAARFAEALYEADYFDVALPLFVEIMDRDPNNADARARVAVIYAREGEMKEAARISRGLLSQGLLGRIVEEFQRSAAGSDESATRLRLGGFYEELGFFEEALHEYQRAAKEPRETLVAYNAMAFLFKRAGFADLSVRQFMRTLEQPGYEDEDLLETRYNLAQLYQETGKYLEAVSMFNEVSAVKLRYRDVAERLEALDALIASGGVKAEVLPFTRAEAETTAEAPPAEAAEAPPAEVVDEPALEAPAPVDELMLEGPPSEDATLDGPPPQDAILTDEATLEGPPPEPEQFEGPPSDDFLLEGAPPGADDVPPSEDTQQPPALEAAEDDFLLEGAPPTAEMEAPAVEEAVTLPAAPDEVPMDDDFFLEGPPPDASSH